MNRTSKRSPGRWATNGFVLLTALVFLFPLYWMIVLSTHAESNVYRFPPPVWPGDEVFRSFQRLLEKIPYFLSLWNSVYVAVLNTFLVLFVSSFAGYGFARYRNAPGNRALFLLVVASLMIPPLAGIIPWFVMMDWLGWINTHWPLIIPPAANAFGVFWMYQFTREAVPGRNIRIREN